MVERITPHAKLHLEKKVILCKLVLQDDFSDHLEWVVSVLVDSGLP